MPSLPMWGANRVWLNQAIVGDSNGDGAFDQLDIVRVLQGAKYLTDEPADWTEGDWNLDGRFDQLDIVTALQAGTYLAKANSSFQSLAEELVDARAHRIPPFVECSVSWIANMIDHSSVRQATSS